MITITQLEEIGAGRQWIKPREWRALTGMSHGSTYALLREGEIRSVRIGDRYFIRRSELNDFFERHGRPAA